VPAALGFLPFLSLGLLTISSRYRPYKSASTQILSCSCAGFLVLICGLTLRSLVLVSAARSPNFESTNPSTQSSGLSEELVPVVALLILLLTLPSVLAIILMVRQHVISKRFAKFIDEASATSKQTSLDESSASPTFAASVSLSENPLRWSPPYADPWPSFKRSADQLRDGFV
jgi:hypothetical protein